MNDPNEDLLIPRLSIDIKTHWVASGAPEVLLTHDAITQTLCRSQWEEGDLVRCKMLAPVTESEYRALLSELSNSGPRNTGGAVS